MVHNQNHSAPPPQLLFTPCARVLLLAVAGAAIAASAAEAVAASVAAIHTDCRRGN
jgi:hypothetical protein